MESGLDRRTFISRGAVAVGDGLLSDGAITSGPCATPRTATRSA